LEELDYEMIPYTPEELIEAANQEFAWCESEMRRASREMGFGDAWKKALEKVKSMYVEPGKQPQSYEQKMMSMRGNNIPFARATVFHELIPGHELQLFMADRYHAYRKLLASTPFAVEGWALYWELRLWDMKFQKTPEDRIGALFWRMHRCARIIFSLSFHLGKMTPDECVNYLTDRAGHERENAIAEVRRSKAGEDGPLYQAAYLLGGMQFYALRTALVGSGKMTDRQFNDAVLHENMMPIELIRASLTRQKLTRDYKTQWKFLSNSPVPGIQWCKGRGCTPRGSIGTHQPFARRA
jgi:hypothetical protein